MTFELMLFPEFKNKAVTLSYDDGLRQDIRLIDIMQKYGLKGTFNLNSGLLQDDNRVHCDEIEKLYLCSGNEIAIHGKFHHSLTALNEEQIIEEIYLDRKNFEERYGIFVTGMAYANGAIDNRVVECIKRCGVDYARTTDSTGDFRICDDWMRLTATCHHNNPRVFELIGDFFYEDTNCHFWQVHPKLFYLWGHSYEFDKENNWDRIEKFAQKIGNRNDVWYATNGEIYRYIQAYKSLRYSAGRNMVYNPSAIDVYIATVNNKRIIVPSGQLIKL